MPNLSRPGNLRRYDVEIFLAGAGYSIGVHSHRATPAGAISNAMGRIKGKDRTLVSGLSVEECPGGDECLLKERGIAVEP